MRDFFTSQVIIPIIGTAIVAALTALWVFIKKTPLIKLFLGSRVFGHGIEYVYKNQKQALKDMQKDIEKSSKMYIFCIRGRSYIQNDGDFSKYLETNKDIRFLLSDPNSSFVKKRAAEIDRKEDVYKADLNTNLNDLLHMTKGRHNIKRKLHSEPPFLRLLLLDNRVYFSFFKEKEMGSVLQIHRAKVTSKFYEGFNRYFNYIWENAADMGDDWLMKP